MGGMRGLSGRSRREGTYVYIQLTHFVVQQKLTQHCEAVVCVCVLSYQCAGLLCPWDFPDKNTGVSFHFLLLGSL